MQAATWPRDEPLDERMLVVDTERELLRDARVRDLPSLFETGDALIVNDAATLPASLHTRDRSLEVRLAGHAGGALKGGLHLKLADGTPMANPMLGAMHALGMTDVTTLGDSTGVTNLNDAPETTVAAL